MKLLTHEQVLHLLRKRQGGLSLRQFAAKLGISAAYLSDVYNHNRQPGRKILAMLGIKKQSTRTVVYFE